MSRRRLSFLLAALLLPPLIFGCLPASAPHATGLGNAKIAVVMSTQITQEHMQGAVVLRSDDDSVTSIPTDGMDAGRALWRKDGLRFSDGKHDYLVNDSVNISPAHHPFVQTAIVSGTDAETYFSVFNEGFGTSGYETYVMRVDKSDKKETLVLGGPYGLGVCSEGPVAGELVGYAPASGKFVEEGRHRFGRKELEFEVLTTFSPDRPQRLLGAAAGLSQNMVDVNSPCIGTKLYSLVGGGADGMSNDYALGSWDTATGKRTSQPLISPEGRPITADPNLTASGKIIPTPDRNTITWMASDGLLRKTVIATGVTTTMGRLPAGDYDYLRFYVTNGVLFVLAAPDDRTQPWPIFRCRATGECSKIAESATISAWDRTHHDTNCQNFAVSPELAEG